MVDQVHFTTPRARLEHLQIRAVLEIINRKPSWRLSEGGLCCRSSPLVFAQCVCWLRLHQMASNGSPGWWWVLRTAAVSVACFRPIIDSSRPSLAPQHDQKSLPQQSSSFSTVVRVTRASCKVDGPVPYFISQHPRCSSICSGAVEGL